MSRHPRVDWGLVLEQAAGIVRSYSTGVTLRQLFYRLVSAQVLPNTTAAYKGLSARSAEARRDRWFPPLVDRTRSIDQWGYFDSPADAIDTLVSGYRLDRTEGQEWSVYIGVEKAGMVNQLSAWFGDLGIAVLALGGYASQTLADEVADDVARQRRPAVLLYGGDYDPSGEDIDRDFAERADCFDKVVRVALSAVQVVTYDLPPNPGKTTDSRATAFVARHGELVQVELDALDPNTLRDLYSDALTDYWDNDAHGQVLEREEMDKSSLRVAAAALNTEDESE